MNIPRPIIRVILLVPVYFGLLMLVGMIGFYPPVYRALGNTFFHRFGSGRIAKFTPIEDPVGIADTGLSVGTDSKGVPGYGATMKISSIREGYAPTALILALVLATPVPWPKRARMLLLGLLLVQIFIAFRITVAALYGFSRLGVGDHHLLEVGTWGITVLRRLFQLVSNDLHVSYLVPLLIWVLLAFTVGDLRSHLGPAGVRQTRKLPVAAAARDRAV